MVKGGVPPLPGLTVFGLWSWGSRPRLFDVSLLRSLAGAGDWGINSSAGQEKPRVSSISALRWFSIAAALGRFAIRSGAGGREMRVWTGFWELGLFGMPVGRLAAGARSRDCAVVRVRYVARNGDTAGLEARGTSRRGGD